MEPVALLELCLEVLPPLPDVEQQDKENKDPAHAHQRQPHHQNVLARKKRNFNLPVLGVARRVGDHVHLRIGDYLGPGVGLGGDRDPEVVQEVRGVAEAEYGVGSLEAEVC